MPARSVNPAPEWTMQDDTTPITGEMVTRYRYASTVFSAADSVDLFLWSYVQHGREYMVEQMQGYYQNIALVAALIGGFSMSTILAPSFDGQPDEGRAIPLFISISGSLIFACLFGCVLDCILIDNSLRLIPDDKYVLDYIRTEQLLHHLPFFLFVAGIILVFTNISIVVYFVYGRIAMTCSFSAFAAVWTPRSTSPKATARQAPSLRALGLVGDSKEKHQSRL